jgi:hypothetical protein
MTAIEDARAELATAVADYRHLFPEPYSLPPNLTLATIFAAEHERLTEVIESARGLVDTFERNGEKAMPVFLQRYRRIMERLTVPTIPYETDEGVVVAVDLDGTVHRMKPTPPTDDEREALTLAFFAWINDGWLSAGTDQHRPSLSEYLADAVLAAGFRRQGPITPATFDPPLSEAEEQAYWDAISDDPIDAG